MTGDLGGTEEKVASRCVVTIEICLNHGSVLENIIYGCHVLIKGRYRRACGVMAISLIIQTVSIRNLKIQGGTFSNSFCDKRIVLNFPTLQKDLSRCSDRGYEIENIPICTHYSFEII